jgi:magnesium and cobalt exporter, CNNM family
LNELIVILALVLANGVFSGAEIAVVALRRARIEELAENGDAGARAVLALREDPERFLATVQIGITVVGSTAAAFGGAAIAGRLAPVLARIDGLAEHADALALGLVVAGISYLSIVLGELVPKSLALRAAERYALAVARPLQALAWIFRPVVWLLSASANLVLRPFGDQTTFTEARHSAQELQQLLDDARTAGTVDADAVEIATRALDLPELTAADVMIPRQEVLMVPLEASFEELRETLLRRAHSRMPVYKDNVDNVVGYINVRDVLARLLEQRPPNLGELLRPAYFVPEPKPIVDLLQEMRERRQPFAIVVDEQGGTAGIVTLEDLVEELVGEIFSEYVASEHPTIERESDGVALVNGNTPVRDVNRALDIELPEDGSWVTIAGLFLAFAGRIPSEGECLTLSGVTLQAVDVSPRRIRGVRVRKQALPPCVVDAANSGG